MQQTQTQSLPTRAGWLALCTALAIAALFILRVTQMAGRQLFCGSLSCPEMLAAALPLYALFVAMTVPTIPLARLLPRTGPSPTIVRTAAIVCALLLVSDVAALTIASYDQMWSDYVQPGGLDAVRRSQLLSPDVKVLTSMFWPLLLGGWLLSMGLGLWRTPFRAIAGLGVIAGLSVVAMSLAEFTFGIGYAEPIALAGVFGWAAWLGVDVLVRAPRTRGVAAG